MNSESPFDTPGRILCGTVVTPDLRASLADYSSQFGLSVVEEGRISPDLARSWGAPAQVARPYALLAAPGGAGCFVRLVEGAAVPDYQALRHFGWAAFEFTVADAFALHTRMDPAAFRVIGAPKLVPGFDNFIPFQVEGRAGEVLYLNTVLNGAMADLDLPHARALVDTIFIAVLATQDRAETVGFHRDRLGFEEGQTWVIPYSMINNSFGLPDDFQTAMTMTKTGRLPACEIDQYPEGATDRPRATGELPPGNAIVSFAVASLEAVTAPFIEPPVVRDGPLYRGRRVATVRGPASELVELVEL